MIRDGKVPQVMLDIVTKVVHLRKMGTRFNTQRSIYYISQWMEYYGNFVEIQIPE